jgi:hypothetical protein
MAKPVADPWHYPRQDIAQLYLKTLDLGLQSARGIFAKRRMGKTEFLNKDLIPAAAKAGYLTAYANLWENKDNPAQALVLAIALAVEPHGVGKLLQRFNTPIKNIKASGKIVGIGEGGLETELADPANVANTTLSMVMRSLDKTKRKLLLAIDEAQVLASADHANFAHALRAALDVRKNSVKVIFAGSSENTLRRMFARSSEPFYNWAPLEPFALLDRDFVEDMVVKVNNLSKYPLSVPDALKAFETLNKTPDFFRQFLDRYLTHAHLGVRAALETTKTKVFNNADFANYWKSLLPADKEVLRMLAEGVQDVHGKAARTRLATALGLGKPASLNTPAQALKRLIDDTTVTRLDHGEYRFEDDAFAQWVRTLDS